MGHFAPPYDRFRAIAAHAGVAERLERLDSHRSQRAAIANERSDAGIGEISRRGDSTEPIAKLASMLTASLHGQLKPAVHQYLSLGREVQFASDPGNTLMSEQVTSLAETNAIERELGSGHSRNFGQDHPSRSLRPAYQAPTEGMIPSEIPHDRTASVFGFGSILGRFGDVFGQGDQHGDPSSPHMTLDRVGGLHTDDGHFSTTAANGSAQEAMAIADELERLRTAVRRSIDELERVRGSVHPALPALLSTVVHSAFRELARGYCPLDCYPPTSSRHSLFSARVAEPAVN